jgi:hypothetical protein
VADQIGGGGLPVPTWSGNSQVVDWFYLDEVGSRY